MRFSQISVRLRAALVTAILPILAAAVHATAFGDFQSKVNSGKLKPYALDLGGILGGTNFHSARVLGFPGFEVGVVGTVQSRPDRDDTILRDAGVQRFGLPMIQAEVGLPFHWDVIGHFASEQGARIFGGGLRYGLHKSGMLSICPDLAVSAFGDKVNHQFFSATHWSVNGVASFHLPILRPYVGVGYDQTRVTVGAASKSGIPGTSATAGGSRLTGGVDIAPIPFLHGYIAYDLLHGLPGVDLGIGIQF